MNNLLDARNLRVQYGQIVALKGVSLYVAPGEAVALVGANGAGKTTLIKTIVGLCVQPAANYFSMAMMSGPSRHIDGSGSASVTHRKASRVFPGLSVRENLEVASFETGAKPAD